MNWKLLIFDVMAITWLILTIYLWPERDDAKQFRDIVMGGLLFFWRIEAHYSFYKKNRRVY